MWPFKQKSVITTALPVDCIFKSIIDALDVVNVEQWKYYHGEFSTVLINKRKNINLSIYNDSANLRGIYSSLFSPSQQEQLNLKSQTMVSAIEKVKAKKLLQKEAKKLKRIFPDCF